MFEQATHYAYEYLNNLNEMEVSPSESSLSELKVFDEPMPDLPCPANDVLSLLHYHGTKNTAAQTGGKYFGFVCGGSLPVSLATKWITELLHLPNDTAAGFVSGSSIAIICALAAARNELLLKQNWDVNKKGLFGHPVSE